MSELLPTWRELPGHPGYEVSDSGEVRSYARIGGRRGARDVVPHLLWPHDHRGYLRVCVGGRFLHVHRLVLLTFVGPPPVGAESRHLNGNSKDNRLCNLAWGSKAQNEADKIAHGTSTAGSRSMRRRLNAPTVKEIRQRAEAGESFAALGRQHGVSWQSIQAIVRRRSWKHL